MTAERDIHAEYTLLQDAYCEQERQLEEKGLSVYERPGTVDWYKFMRAHDANINPSFKPSSEVTPENSMAIFAGDVGVNALRVYDMDDIRDWLSSGKLWGVDDPTIECLPLPEGFPKISGRVAQIGGLRVVRNGEKIGKRLDMLARIAAARIGAKHIIALRRAERTTGQWLDYYASERTAPVYEDYPFYGQPINIHLTHCSALELSSRFMDGRDS